MYWSNNNQGNSRPRPVGLYSGGTQLVIVVALLVIVAVGAFAAGYMAAHGGSDDRLKIFNEAYDIIDKQFYYPKPSDQERAYGAIQGVIATLKDSHTIFLPPEPAQKEVARIAGKSGGIGVVVSQNDAKQMVIADVRRGWPADLAGVRPGDIVLKVDGTDISKMSIDDASDLIRGDLGTKVTITLKRASVKQPIDVTITRGQINVYGTMLDGKIAYITFSLFDDTSADLIRSTLSKLLAQKPIGLILDIRNNPGGLRDAGIKIADIFLPEGPIMSEKDYTGEVQRYTAKTGDIGESIPMAVLVNGNSASAAEILSGALKDRKRAPLIGERTYGKGSVQSVTQLSDGSQLRVTVGAWYTPNETPIQETKDGQPGGLVPDITVPMPDNRAYGVDPQLDAAIEYLEKLYGTF